MLSPESRRFVELEARAERERGAETDRAPIRFRTGAEILATTPEAPDWILDGYLAPGAVTILAGKPKAGKSTIALAAVEAIATDAARFLGRTVRGCPVVYLTEEDDGTLRHKLPDTERVSFATRNDAWPKPEWVAAIGDAAAECERIGAKLLVVDTLAFWAGLAAEKEKDAGAVQAVMDALSRAASVYGVAVLLVHHAKKGSRHDDVDGLRGSSAIAGAVDIVLQLDRPDDQRPSQRQLIADSRFPGSPGSLIYERSENTDGQHGYRVVAEADDRAGAVMKSRHAKILDALPPDGSPIGRPEFAERLGVSPKSVAKKIKPLVDGGRIRVEGESGNAFTYRRENTATSPASTRVPKADAGQGDTPTTTCVPASSPLGETRGAGRESSGAGKKVDRWQSLPLDRVADELIAEGNRQGFPLRRKEVEPPV